jgi:signal transduction histidine kinase
MAPTPPYEQTDPRKAWIQDIALVAILMLPVILASALRPYVQVPPPTAAAIGRPPAAEPWAYALLAACFIPLVARRRWPLAVLAATTALAALLELLPAPPSMALLAVLLAVYTVGARYDRRTLLVATCASGAVMLAAKLIPRGGGVFWADAVPVTALIVAAAMVGDATRNRRAYIAEVERRAIEAERSREEEAARRVDEERLRIARELHDITAHSLSVIAVQSGAAEHVLDDDPEAARRALRTIRDTSKNALTELRATLGVLRAAGDEAAPLAPTPGLVRVGELIEPLEAAGFRVTLALAGPVAEIPATVDASAYRVVQEALTNVMRHAGAPCAVDVSIEVASDELRLVVTDEGSGLHDGDAEPVPAEDPDDRPARTGSGGHGIVGMRERVRALGGSFGASPRPGGGFAVTATIPLGTRHS